MKLRTVMDITCLARSTIYKHIADGIFSKPVSLGERAVAWVESEVQDWGLGKIEQSDGSLHHATII
ncbi:AlpA family phage regulatory protein [Amphritea sp. 1_MG-2023]|uniref:AlpA family phage regulatory protein n=1 Tax=Amphritea sp. 1_MG-2023 TaxID=3062670 RepID=UPI0026E20F5B|nr:AlpA family phage regulatory protein [Amphritea sp. 1_MG-2023]MDO6562643.1 AlpA family phage regulatory protein [Amphritea sp. 1_MG-2023]